MVFRVMQVDKLCRLRSLAIGKTLRNPNFHKPVEEEPDYSSGWKCEDMGKGTFLGMRGHMYQCWEDLEEDEEVSRWC